jgi:hypothetical protein
VRPGGPSVIQVGPWYARCAQGSRGPHLLYRPGQVRSKVHPHPNTRHAGWHQRRGGVHSHQGGCTCWREAPHTQHVAAWPSTDAGRRPGRTMSARDAAGSPGWSSCTHGRHHGGHAASKEEHSGGQQRCPQHICMHPWCCVLTWCTGMGAVKSSAVMDAAAAVDAVCVSHRPSESNLLLITNVQSFPTTESAPHCKAWPGP